MSAAVVAPTTAAAAPESAHCSASSAPTRRHRASVVVDIPGLMEKVTKNFTMVSNEILDLLTLQRLRPVTSAVLVFLVRQTLGSWGKSARSSCDLSTREIANRMGFKSHAPVVRAIQDLEEKRIIWITRQARPTGRRGPQGRSIFLTDPSEWRLDLHSGAGSAPDPSDSSGAESAPQLVPNQHQKRCEISTNFAAKPADPKEVRAPLRLQREDDKKEDKAKPAQTTGAGAPSSSSFTSGNRTAPTDVPSPVLPPHQDFVTIDGQVLFVPDPPLPGPATPELLAHLWNHEVPDGHPRVGLSARTRAMAKAVIAIEPDPTRWRDAFREVAFSEFLTGKTPTKNGRAPFIVPFEWFIRIEDGRLVNVEKALSGQYRTRGQDCRAGLSWSQHTRGLSACQTLRDFEREREEEARDPRPKITPEEREQLQRDREENTGDCGYCGQIHDLRRCPLKLRERFRDAGRRAEERTIAMRRGEALPIEPVYRDVPPELDF